MILDELKLIAFFGKTFAENAQSAFKLKPTAHINFIKLNEDGYYVEVITPNPLSKELDKIIGELCTSPGLHVDIQMRLKEAGKLSLWQTSDTPPSIMLTS